MNTTSTAVFLGGVATNSLSERELAYRCGRSIGRMGYTLFHGGYNGLMEDAARGASEEGVQIFAITLIDKEEWGGFNPYTTRAIYVTDLGQRLNAFFSAADIVIAMGGGVGTLHEIAAAIWYASNVRRIPVVLLGERAERLLSTLKDHGWIYESPTRPVDFLRVVYSAEDLDIFLSDLHARLAIDQETDEVSLKRRLLDTAMVNGIYVRADGTKLHSYFDPFRLYADPKLVHRAAMAIATQITGSLDVVAGIAMGGVPLATHVASLIGKPLLIIRRSPKNYGSYAKVEGLMSPGCRALVVDDVVRRGTTIATAQKDLEAVDIDVTEAACVLSYGRSGYTLLQDHGVMLHSLIVRTDHEDPSPTNLSGGE